MTWTKLSDTLHSHPKWTNASVDAKALWTTAASYCGAYLTNGEVHAAEHLPTIAIETFGPTPSAFRKAKKAAAELVDRRLWETTSAGWKFHDWRDNNPTAAQVKQKRKKDRRRSDLHKTTEGKQVKKIVRERDGDWCRYCGIVVRWGANRATDGGTYDHIDPEGPNTVENLVVACNYCNGRKQDCLPEDAGMELRPEPLAARRPRIARPSASTRPNRDPIATRSAESTEPGSGRVGSGRDWTGRDGPGRHAAAWDDPPPHDDSHAPPEELTA